MGRVRRKDIVVLLMRIKIRLGVDLGVGSCVRGVGVRVVVAVVVRHRWCDHDVQEAGWGPRRGEKEQGRKRRRRRMERWKNGQRKHKNKKTANPRIRNDVGVKWAPFEKRKIERKN